MVEQGDAWAAVIIYENFTWNQVVRMCSIASEQCKDYPLIPPPNEDTINQSTIHLKADVTSTLQLSHDCIVCYLWRCFYRCSDHNNHSEPDAASV